MRILVIGNFLSAGLGSRGVCEDLANRLEGKGHSVLRTSSRSTRAGRLLDMLWTIRARRDEYDLAQLDLFGGAAFRWGEIVSRWLSRQGRPFVITLHGGSLPDLAQREQNRVAKVLARASRVTSPSPYLARELKAIRDDIVPLPNGIDTGSYPSRIRQSCEPRIVWLRAFHSIYRPDLAIRVLAGLRHRVPDAQLAMIGPDKRDGSLGVARDLVRTLGLHDHVSFEGQVAKEAVGDTLARGDIFLNTSSIDNAPVTVVEAMACGMCVVTTDAGGMKDLIRHEESGLIVPADDTAAMTAAVQRLLDEPPLAQHLSHNARTEASTHDWSRVLPLWEALFREVAAEAH